MLWLKSAVLLFMVVMICVFLVQVIWQGTVTYWVDPIERVTLKDGRVLMGSVVKEETVNGEHRELLRTANFDLTGSHFTWIADHEIVSRDRPVEAVEIERLEWGRFVGFMKELRDGENVVASDPGEILSHLRTLLPEVENLRSEKHDLQQDVLGGYNHRLERARLGVRQAELDHGVDAPEVIEARNDYATLEQDLQSRINEVMTAIQKLEDSGREKTLVLETVSGREKTLHLVDVVRVLESNDLSTGQRWGIYFDRWVEFLTAEPREANSEGGILPAIVGTVIMTMLMTILVVPLGVMSAIYMREYATQGSVISLIRIAVNNLAGVPSIVFGVFGLGFFCYVIGGTIDELFFEASLPNPTYGKGGLMWASLTLALLTLPVVIVTTEEALAAVPNSLREGSYACGAGKFETIRRILIPKSLPGIITGLVLAIARGAGEVAPLMLVGAVKLAPEWLVDGNFPYLHSERSFMHLGFHIYDLGFQSQNAEAARPMVYLTTLILILLVLVLNATALRMRSKISRKYKATRI